MNQDYLHLSGIQHYAFCRRQWALIYVEQQWQDNTLTFQGQELHKKTNDPFITEKRGDIIIARAIPIVSHTLMLYGIADVVEFHRVEENGIRLYRQAGNWCPIPVEYKSGRPKRGNCDVVQLCAQAICLEETFDLQLQQGHMYYGKTRRRLDVELSDSLRQEVRDYARQMHSDLEHGVTPKAVRTEACERCSLIELCVPQLSEKLSLSDYVMGALK